MDHPLICCICRNDAIHAASLFLAELGLPIVFTPRQNCSHLLLPVPSFPTGDSYIEPIVKALPDNVIISGGNLTSEKVREYEIIDFLKDPLYLAQNAAITARCARTQAERQLSTSLKSKRILILGFGRISKCLSKELRILGAEIYIAARKDSDLALITALGFHAVPIHSCKEYAEHADIIFNTVPEMVLPDYDSKRSCAAFELASSPGIGGNNVISARGLPAKMAPSESGELIAKTFIRLSL